MTARWSLPHPQSPVGVGEVGKTARRRRALNPPRIHEAWWWIAYAAAVLLFVLICT